MVYILYIFTDYLKHNGQDLGWRGPLGIFALGLIYRSSTENFNWTKITLKI